MCPKCGTPMVLDEWEHPLPGVWVCECGHVIEEVATQENEQQNNCEYCGFDEYRIQNMETKLKLPAFSALNFKYCPMCGHSLQG